MSDPTLIRALESLPTETDFTDPATYAKLLGYDEQLASGGASEEGQQGGAQAETATGAPAPSPAGSATAGAGETTAPAEQIAGVLTRDGKHVIPYRVHEELRSNLASERTAKADLQRENQELREQLQRMQSGTATKADQATDDGYTPERLAQLDEDYPEMANLIRQVRELRRQSAAGAPAAPAASPAASPAAAQDPAQQALQDAIDQVPLLAQWQVSGGMAWQAAVQHDKALRADPAWANKPMAERFEEATKRVLKEFGIPNLPATAPAQADPQPSQSTALPTLTDFNGTPATVGDPMKSQSVDQMRSAAYGMDMEQLRKLAGLSY